MHEAAPLAPGSSLPQSFLLKCSEQVRKIQVDSVMLQEVMVRESQGQQEGKRRPGGSVGGGHQEGARRETHTGKKEKVAGARL